MRKKAYQILIAALIVLFGYLVFDFFQGRAEVASVLAQLEKDTDLPKPGTVKNPSGSKFPSLGAIIALAWERIWFPQINLPVNPVTQPTRLNLVLKGTIIETGRTPIAFILNQSTGQERSYPEKFKIDGWEITKITEGVVTLTNEKGETTKLTVDKGWSGAITPQSIDSVLKDVAGMAAVTGGIPYDILEKLANKSVSVEELKPQIKSIVDTLPPKFVLEQIQKFTGLDGADIASNTDMGEYVTRLLQLNQGEAIAPVGDYVTISFAAKVNPDNSPIEPATSFKTTAPRIYSCFQNQEVLKGLTKVITRWTDTTNGEVIYLGTKPLDAASAWNFIWVERKQGWTPGTYEIELLTAGKLEKVGGGTFKVE
ncbi:MAG: hypothetical protein HY762_01185 [Planctomycetes bacterium]|nr:hypothetical protein [Planctomycetota bacterium]